MCGCSDQRTVAGSSACLLLLMQCQLNATTKLETGTGCSAQDAQVLTLSRSISGCTPLQLLYQ